MQAPGSELFLLADQCLGTRVARRVRVSGNRIATIQDEWPGRDLQANPPPDEEIIRHLHEKAGRRALWITQDWNAFRRHGQALHASSISVLWLLWPKYSRLSAADKSHVVQLVIETVYRLVLNSDAPVYFQVRLESMTGYQPILERLRGSVLDRPIDWQRIPLDIEY